jgi:cephalosporin-C deacetylase-like acetyl esterase
MYQLLIIMTLVFGLYPRLMAATAADGLTWEITSNNPDAVYRCGENALFTVKLLKDKKPAIGYKVRWAFSADGKFCRRGIFNDVSKPMTVTVPQKVPGWTRIRFIAVGSDGKDVKRLHPTRRSLTISVRVDAGAMAEPEKIRVSGKEPVNFDAFWKKQTDLLKTVPVKAKLTQVPVPAKYQGKLECFDVLVDCPGRAPASGYLVRPVKARKASLPAVVVFHGASSWLAKPQYELALKGALAFDFNAHGFPNSINRDLSSLRAGKLKNYRQEGKNDPEKFYFRDMILRGLRALEYAKSCPEYDGTRLFVYGRSQGGYQSVAVAALDPDVKLTVAEVPAMGDIYGVCANPPRQENWPNLYRALEPGKPDNPTVAAATAYYDSAFFARRIKNEIYLSTGFTDTTVPPTGVLSIFHELPEATPKDLQITPFGGHGSSPAVRGRAELDRRLKEKDRK